MWDIKQKATNEQTRQIKQKFTDTDNSMVVRREGGEGGRGKGVTSMVTEGDSTSGGEHTVIQR